MLVHTTWDTIGIADLEAAAVAAATLMIAELVTTVDVDLASIEITVLMTAAIATERSAKFTTRKKNASDLAVTLDALLATEVAPTDGLMEAVETVLEAGDAEDGEVVDLVDLSVPVATDVRFSNG
jgi:hypothetical protein